MIRRLLLLAVMAAAFCQGAQAQKYPERRIMRSGNKDFKEGSYLDSEVKYRQALEMVPGMYEGLFNLGDALYKQERFDDAARMWERVAADSTRSKVERAEALYNIGNGLFRQQKLQEALEKYKESLRLNPFDRDAKFNLALTKKLLEENQDDNRDNRNNQDDNSGGGDQNQNQNQDGSGDNNNDNKDNKDNKDNQDNKDDRNNQNNPDNKDNESNGDNPDNPDGKNNPDRNEPDKPQPSGQQPSGMSRDEAERMLQAMQNEEDKTRDKVDRKKAAAVAGAKSGKNW